MEVLEEISEINGVYKKYSDGSSYYIIDNNRNLYTWGENDYGQLGIGNTDYQTTPQKINGISNIVEVYMYCDSVIAKDSSGNLYAWGDNEYGQLGIGNTENQSSPVLINNFVDNKGIESFGFFESNGNNFAYKEEFYIVANDESCYLYTWFMPKPM